MLKLTFIYDRHNQTFTTYVELDGLESNLVESMSFAYQNR